jgi:hypothetical protein
VEVSAAPDHLPAARLSPTMSPPTAEVPFYASLTKPLLILSSRAGRGNTSIAEAIQEHFNPADHVFHRSIEDFLPRSAVDEDLVRYKFISNHFPALLSAIYTLPLFYYRKRVREERRTTRLPAYKAFLIKHGIATVVCVSHRQAFWTTVLKRNESLGLTVYGVLTEFGTNLGWKYIFWEAMDGFISPVEASTLNIGLPPNLPFHQLSLPARSEFGALASTLGSKRQCLVMGGLWGQGRMLQTVQTLLSSFPRVHIHVVCGENKRLQNTLANRFRHVDNLTIYGVLDSIAPVLSRCLSVVTKPGMGTLLEAQASRRKIFLFPGLPVAELNNARHAIAHFDAEWFSPASFGRWLDRVAD